MGRHDAVEDIADRYGLHELLELVLTDDLPHRPEAIVFDLAGLPVLHDADGAVLDPTAITTLVDLLRATSLTPPCSLLRRVRAALFAADLDAFALALFDRFFATGERDADRCLDDRCVVLAPETAVSVAHPVTMTDEERDAWAVSFADHEIIQAFEQLARQTFAGPAWPSWTSAARPIDAPTDDMRNVGWGDVVGSGFRWPVRLTLDWSGPMSVTVEVVLEGHVRVFYGLRLGGRSLDPGPAPLIARSELARALAALGASA